jgi:hypothetical protein
MGQCPKVQHGWPKGLLLGHCSRTRYNTWLHSHLILNVNLSKRSGIVNSLENLCGSLSNQIHYTNLPKSTLILTEVEGQAILQRFH